MARRVLTVKRMILVLGVATLVLGGISLLVLVRQATLPPPPESGSERLARQVRQQRGAAYEVRFLEAGRGRALCGYAGPRHGTAVAGQDAVAFVSRPNRILFADDPLPAEFADMRERFCPGFAALNPPAPVP